MTIALRRAGRSGKPQHPFDRRASGDCNVHRAALAAGELQLSVRVAQGQKHHDVSGSRRAEGRCHCILCTAVGRCALLTAWLLFMAGARAAAGKGDRRGLRYSPGDAFPPAAYQDDGTQCQKAVRNPYCVLRRGQPGQPSARPAKMGHRPVSSVALDQL